MTTITYREAVARGIARAMRVPVSTVLAIIDPNGSS